MVIYASCVGYDPSYLYHHGIKGQQWGVRRFQEEDGSYTNNGKDRHAKLEAKRVDRLEESIQKDRKILNLAKKTGFTNATIGNIQRGKIAKKEAKKELRDARKELKKKGSNLLKNKNMQSLDELNRAKQRYDAAKNNKIKVYKENKSLGKTLKNQQIKRDLKSGKSERVAKLRGAALGTVFGVGTKALIGAAAVGIGHAAVTSYLNTDAGRKMSTITNIAFNNLKMFF